MVEEVWRIASETGVTFHRSQTHAMGVLTHSHSAPPTLARSLPCTPPLSLPAGVPRRATHPSPDSLHAQFVFNVFTLELNTCTHM